MKCIAIEVIAQRTNKSESKDDSIRRVFGEVADLTGYDRYRKVGFAFFKLTRNGLAHGFYPNDVELANGPRGGILLSFWIDAATQRSICIEAVGERSASGHLVNRQAGERVLLNVSVQHLHNDIASYATEFLGRLRVDPSLQALVERHDERLLKDATDAATASLEPGDFIALGL